MYVYKNNNHNNSSESNDNDDTINNHNKSELSGTRRKEDHEHGLKLSMPILK